VEYRKLAIIRARVFHARHSPKKNVFEYSVFYTKIAIQKLMNYPVPFGFSFNKWNIFSLYAKDYGKRQSNSDWHSFICDELRRGDIPFNDRFTISLISHPRLFGFAFNPISYWVLEDEEHQLKAVLCEVHNTFKQSHNYLLSKPDNSAILPSDIFVAQKHLYVSPFNKSDGYYEFAFSYTQNSFNSAIRYFDATGTHVLSTSLTGVFGDFTTLTILKTVILYPFMTLLVVFRIHWQAAILYFKKVKSTLRLRKKDIVNNQTTRSQKLKGF
jgi:DUF1365 family protein